MDMHRSPITLLRPRVAAMCALLMIAATLTAPAAQGQAVNPRGAAPPAAGGFDSPRADAQPAPATTSPATTTPLATEPVTTAPVTTAPVTTDPLTTQPATAPIDQSAAATVSEPATPIVATLLPFVTAPIAIPEGTQYGYLRTVFNGFGYVEMRPDALHLSPQSAVGPVLNSGAFGYNTHAALVSGNAAIPAGTYSLRFSVKTVAQLRAVNPASWERAWLLFDYVDPDNFSYLVLKANGWELGHLENAVQGFDATGSDRYFPVGAVDKVTVVRSSERLTIVVNNVTLFDTANTRPAMSQVSAVYTEDAHIAVDLWTISNAPPRTAATPSGGGNAVQPRAAAPSAPTG